jgi:hypothetical protein
MNNQKYKLLAAIFVDLHNQASKEYTIAFNKIKTRMWHDDDAHPLKKSNEEFIASQMKRGFFGYDITYPLTVLDSYPNISSKDRQWLELEVNKIFIKYNKKWKTVLKKFKLNKR